jgi:hypothetical protein
MNRSLSRRSFFLTGCALISPQLPGRVLTASVQSTASRDPVPATFPTQDPEVVREVVRVAHFDLKRLKEFVDARPTLARAAWDWGFGDWESALGAASHVGNREIAEYLIRNGARPTLFSATMLGQLDVVTSFIGAAPGVQKILGPHGITLMAHAKAGGPAAAPVVAYLEKVGDADPKIASPALTDAEIESFAGTYRYGSGPTEHIIIDGEKGQLGFMRANAIKRGLARRGPGEFSPAGAPQVRIKFVVEGQRAVRLDIFDPELMLSARHV